MTIYEEQDSNALVIKVSPIQWLSTLPDSSLDLAIRPSLVGSDQNFVLIAPYRLFQHHPAGKFIVTKKFRTLCLSKETTHCFLVSSLGVLDCFKLSSFCCRPYFGPSVLKLQNLFMSWNASFFWTTEMCAIRVTVRTTRNVTILYFPQQKIMPQNSLGEKNSCQPIRIFILQFALRIAFRGVLHRCGNQEIHR